MGKQPAVAGSIQIRGGGALAVAFTVAVQIRGGGALAMNDFSQRWTGQRRAKTYHRQYMLFSPIP